MCGSVSAIGLQEAERELWPYLRDRLREPGHLMAMMRGLLGDTEVAAIVAVTPQGLVKPVAIMALPEVIAQEIQLRPDDQERGGRDWLRRATVGDYDIEVVMGAGPDAQDRPLAILSTPWIEQHLLLYARVLWHRRRDRRP